MTGRIGMLAAAAAVTMLAGAAGAATVLTQDEAAFAAGTTAFTLTTETFDSLISNRMASFDAGAFTIAAPSGFAIDALFFCRSGRCARDFSRSVTLTFDQPVNALGFFLGNGNGFGSEVLVDGVSVGSISTSGAYVFVGVFGAGAGFTTVTLPGGLLAFEIDDVTFGTAPPPPAPVPLPASLPLLGGALAGLGLWARRQRV